MGDADRSGAVNVVAQGDAVYGEGVGAFGEQAGGGGGGHGELPIVSEWFADKTGAPGRSSIPVM
jgi:hypothetical protein